MSTSASGDAPAAPAPTSLKNGILLTLLIIAGVVGWIVVGGVYLGVKSFFASFLFAWYWANLEHADVKRLPHALIGAMVGLALAWQTKLLPEMAPQLGLTATTATIIAVLILVAAIFIQVMNWLPIALNASAMLFLTVLAAPALLTTIDFVEMTKALVGGAVFFTGVVYVAKLYMQVRARANPAPATA